MTDRSEAVAGLIREYRNADRGELLRAIVCKWPDLAAEELRKGIELATQNAPPIVRGLQWWGKRWR